MKKAMIGISILVVLLVAVSQAAARYPIGWGLGCAANLNLTDEQIGKFDILQQEYFKEIIPARNELGSKALELRAILAQPSADRTKVTAIEQEMLALQQKLQEKSWAYRLRAREILTPQQVSMLPPGYGLGFSAWRGHGQSMGYDRGRGRGMGRGMGPCMGIGRGYGRSMGRGMGPGMGIGRAMGYGPGNCPYGYR